MASDDLTECEDLFLTASMIEDIENPTNDEILDAAMSFYDSALCFDNNGDRKQSAKCFTLAGEFYLAIEENAKAAECYGKAILRNLMTSDIQAAQVILDKGEEYGDIFDTFHFRMAKDAFSRQVDENEDIEDELKELKDSESLFDKESLDYELELPESEIENSFNLELEEIDLNDFADKDMFNINENLDEATTFVSSIKGFTFSNSAFISSDTSEKYSESLVYNLLKNTRRQVETKILSAGVGKGMSGFVKDLESETKIFRKDFFKDKRHKGTDMEIDSLSDLVDDFTEDQVDPSSLDLTLINDSLTLESEFISISEISADDDDLEDVEVQDSIPYGWQIKDIDTGGFELLSQDIDRETGSLVFTWKRNKLARGEKARIKYILRRRLQRSIAMISKNRVYVMESFHSISEGDQSSISMEFENPYNDPIDHLLIEDVVPDEIKIIGRSNSAEKSSLQVYSTKQGLIYRWILEDVGPKQSFTIEYEVIDRPYTRWFEQIYNLNGVKALKVEKIAEPLIEFLDNQYVLFIELQPDNTISTGEIILKDEIPMDAELLSSYPVWFRPTIEINEVNQKFLTWTGIGLEGKTRRVCVRLRIKNNYNPQESLIEFKDYKLDLNTKTKKEDKAEGVLDLRRRMGLALVNKID